MTTDAGTPAFYQLLLFSISYHSFLIRISFIFSSALSLFVLATCPFHQLLLLSIIDHFFLYKNQYFRFHQLFLYGIRSLSFLSAPSLFYQLTLFTKFFHLHIGLCPSGGALSFLSDLSVLWLPFFSKNSLKFQLSLPSFSSVFSL